MIQKSVQDPLAELILSGSIKDGEKVAISAGQRRAGVQRRGGGGGGVKSRRPRETGTPVARLPSRTATGAVVDPLAHVLDEIARRRFRHAGDPQRIGPPELSTLIASQKKPRVWATSAICDSGRCSSVRFHGVSQKPTILVEMPTRSAIMRAGNKKRVRLK